MTPRPRVLLLVALAALGVLVLLGSVLNVAAGEPYAVNALAVGVGLLALGPVLRARRNLARMVEHRALAARADASR